MMLDDRIADVAEQFIDAEAWLGKKNARAEAAKFAGAYARDFAAAGDARRAVFFLAVEAHILGRGEVRLVAQKGGA